LEHSGRWEEKAGRCSCGSPVSPPQARCGEERKASRPAPLLARPAFPRRRFRLLQHMPLQCASHLAQHVCVPGRRHTLSGDEDDVHARPWRTELAGGPTHDALAAAAQGGGAQLLPRNERTTPAGGEGGGGDEGAVPTRRAPPFLEEALYLLLRFDGALHVKSDPADAPRCDARAMRTDACDLLRDGPSGRRGRRETTCGHGTHGTSRACACSAGTYVSSSILLGDASATNR
jgi:hypothetical protein